MARDRMATLRDLQSACAEAFEELRPIDVPVELEDGVAITTHDELLADLRRLLKRIRSEISTAGG